MPEDVLFLIFEEDFRFWPLGEDPDCADDYKARLSDVMKKRMMSRSGNKMKQEDDQEDPAPQTGASSSSASGAYRPGVKGKEQKQKHHHGVSLRPIEGIHR